MIHITRRERFNAAHRLFRSDWSEEKNNEIFGGCANPNWHGHNYELFVTVKGNVNPELGYVINLKDLSGIIRTYITNRLDHRNLNVDVDFLRDVMTSTENVAIAIWRQLDPHIRALGCSLHCVKLVETENNYVEYFGE
ncbi:MAG: 6-pyruvoyl tetrahydrobiopterin synthase [Bacteroidetes bacterium]|nr:MAG: 6-pyruvoyl tetrahydrobiopterin synthase [Bacteroidota bacterium]